MNVVAPGGISGSRLGFKGSEDLGDGLQAVYRLEFGSLKNDISSGITSTRATSPPASRASPCAPCSAWASRPKTRSGR